MPLLNSFRLASLASLFVLTSLTCALQAQGAVVTVNGCRHADGTPAPTDGFAFSISGSPGIVTASNDCAVGGSVKLAMSSGTLRGASQGVYWTNDAIPSSVTLGKVESWSTARLSGAVGNQKVSRTVADPTGRCDVSPRDLSANIDTGSPPQDLQGDGVTCYRGTGGTGAFLPRGSRGWGTTLAPLAPENYAARTDPRGVGASVSCRPSLLADSPPPDSCEMPSHSVEIFRVAYGLDDSAAPTAGPTAGGSTVAGRTVVRVRASDEGVGVQSVQPLIDGAPAGPPAAVTAANDARCRQQADGSYDYVRPCPASVDSDVELDFSAAENGARTLALRYRDAAGNVADSSPVSVVIDNTPKPAIAGIVQPPGSLRVGSTVTVSSGQWRPSSTALSYQWLRCPAGTTIGCVEIPGATGAGYALDEGDLNRSVVVRVTGTVGKYSDAAVSTPTPVLKLDRTGNPVEASPFTNPLLNRGHTHNGSGTAESATVTASFRIEKRQKVLTRAGGKRRTTYRVTTTSLKTATVQPARTLRLAGSLKGVDGKMIDGAILVIGARNSVGSFSEYGRVTTNRNGVYSANIRWGSNRQLQVAWFPYGDSPEPVLSREVIAKGVGRVTLNSSSASRARGVTYRGTALNAGAGTVVRVQARDGNRWVTLVSPRTDRNGQFVGRRSLKKIAAGRRLCVRARVTTQGTFAYATGTSSTRCARVR